MATLIPPGRPFLFPLSNNTSLRWNPIESLVIFQRNSFVPQRFVALSVQKWFSPSLGKLLHRTPYFSILVLSKTEVATACGSMGSSSPAIKYNIFLLPLFSLCSHLTSPRYPWMSPHRPVSLLVVHPMRSFPFMYNRCLTFNLPATRVACN